MKLSMRGRISNDQSDLMETGREIPFTSTHFTLLHVCFSPIHIKSRASSSIGFRSRSDGRASGQGKARQGKARHKATSHHSLPPEKEEGRRKKEE